MAEGQGQGDQVFGLGLDISQYLTALREALEAYNVFAQNFSKTLSIRLDPTSLNALSNAFGVQMRQAVSIMKGGAKESVEESVKAVKQINSEFRKVGSFGEPFRDLPKKVREAREKTVGELGRLKDSAKAAGDAVGKALSDGMAKGADAAKRQLADVNAVGREVTQTQFALAKGQEQIAARAQASIEKRLQKYGQQLGPGGRERLEQKTGLTGTALDLPAVTKTVGIDKGVQQRAIDARALAQSLRDLRQAFNEESIAAAQSGATLERISPFYERAAALYERLSTRFNAASARVQQRTLELAAQAQRRVFAETGDQAAIVGGTGYTNIRTLEDFTRTVPGGDENEKKLQFIAQRKAQILSQSLKQAEDEEKARERLAKATWDEARKQQKLADQADYKNILAKVQRDREIERSIDASAKQSADAWNQDAKAVGRLVKEKAKIQADLEKQGAAIRAATQRWTDQLQAKGTGLEARIQKLPPNLQEGLVGRLNQMAPTPESLTRYNEKGVPVGLNQTLLKKMEQEVAQEEANLKAAKDTEISHYRVNEQLRKQARQVADATKKADEAATAWMAGIRDRISRLPSAVQDRVYGRLNQIAPTIQSVQRFDARGVPQGLRKGATDAVAREIAKEEDAVKQAEKETKDFAVAMRQATRYAIRIAETLAKNNANIPAYPAPTGYVRRGGPGERAFELNRQAVASDLVGARAYAGGRGGKPPVPPSGQGFLQPDPENYRKSNDEAQRLLKTQNGIGLSIAETARRLGAWLFFYRAVHLVTRSIENAISGFVRSGIEYNRQLEQQQLALRGILSESLEIRDATHKQLTGMAALTALQVTAARQWSQIQQASLSVVGTTADLMGLYAGILPFATKLGADLDTVQKLTQSTAVAAGLLDVSFQDARSAIISLLQGRALVRNRLVGALGFTREEIASLKGTPELLDHVMAKMDSFLLLSDEASNTFAAMSESFKDFVGIAASGFTQPFVEGFKQFVAALSATNGEFAIFEKTVTGFKLKDNLKAFLDFASHALGEVVNEIKEFGKSFARSNAEGLELFVEGIKDIVLGLVKFAEYITLGTAALTKFIAQNRELIRWLGYAITIGAVVNIFQKLSAAITTASAESSIFIRILAAMFNSFKQAGSSAGSYGDGLGQVTTKAGTARGAITGLKGALNSLGGALVVTGILYSLGLVIQRLAQVKQEADAAKRRIKAVEEGDIGGVRSAAQEGLASPDIEEQVAAARDVVTVIEKKIGDLQRLFGGDITPSGAIRKAEATRAELTGVSEDRQRVVEQLSLQKSKLARLKNPESAEGDALRQSIATLTEQQGILEEAFHAAEKESQLADTLLQDIKDGLAERNRILDIIAKAKAPGDLENKAEMKARSQPNFDWNVNDLERRLSLVTGFAQNTGFVDIYNRNREPELTAKPLEKEEKTPRYKSRAADLIEPAEQQAQIENAIIERDLKMRVITEEQAAKKQADIQKWLLEVKLYYWTQEEEHFKTHVAAMKKEDPEKARASKEEFENTARDIQLAKRKAQTDLTVFKYGQEGDEAQRLQKDKDALLDAQKELARIQAQIYGTVEETALASFDKTVNNIREKLEKLANDSPQFKKQVEGVLAEFASARKEVGAQASDKAIMANTAKQLDAVTQQQSLLTKQFEVGAVSAETYLKRLNEYRAQETGLLEDQAGAIERDIARLQQGVAKIIAASAMRGLAGMATPRDAEELAAQLAAANAEIARLQAQLDGTRERIIDINSEARRVQAALEAWGNAVSNLSEFLNITEGMTEGIGRVNAGLLTSVGLVDKIVKSAYAFAQIPKTFSMLNARLKDAGFAGGIGASAKALGGLIASPFRSQASKVAEQVSSGIGNIDSTTGQVTKAASNFTKAIPLIGMGISAALSIGTYFFQKAVEKAKKDIQSRFQTISDALSDGTKTLGESIGAAKKEQAAIIAQYSKSKSGRAALKDLKPEMDRQIKEMERQAKQTQKTFLEAYRRMVDEAGNTIKSGPYADFLGQLLDLEKQIKDYLDSFDRTTKDGLKAYTEALDKVRKYTSAFFENAKRQFEESMIGFEAEALSAQERVFSLINENNGLYTQLRDIGEQRLDLEEAIQDEQERRKEAQQKINDLANRELEIRKQIAEVIRQAAEDELAIRRRGVLEAQLTIAQQKAVEISQVRHRAQDEIDKLKKELEDLKNDAEKARRDELKQQKDKDRDFARQGRGLDEREAEIRKQLRLNDIRLAGARAVAEIEGAMFGMATDEFDLAARQNEIAVKQAQLQVEKWKETKNLVDAIIETAEGFMFEPPPGFPQIKVELGSIIIDNRDQSNNNFPPGGGGGGGGGGPQRPQPQPPRPNPNINASNETYGSNIGNLARKGGYGDIA